MMKAPEPGRVKTRLAAEIGPTLATACYCRFVEFLVRRILACPARSWHSHVVYDPPEARSRIESWLNPLAPGALTYESQIPGDLGERLSAAFERRFEAGATSVLAIGTDCLELSAGDIETAFQALTTHEVVMGPAEDGGYWCIGLSVPHLDLFEAMPWSGPTLAEATRRRARERDWRLAELPARMDVDHRDDLERLPAALREEIGLPESAGFSERTAGGAAGPA